MRIKDEVRKCAVFLGYREAQGREVTIGATAFFVSVKAQDEAETMYLVTAAHVLDEIKSRTKGKGCSVDGQVVIRANARGGAVVLEPVHADSWHRHATDKTVDAAAIPWEDAKGAIEDDFDFDYLDETMVVTPQRIIENGIGVGDPVYTVGLFQQFHGTMRNVPVVRFGLLAAMREERVATDALVQDRDVYLVDARSTGGVSGSPVFLTPDGTRPVPTYSGGVFHGVPTMLGWLGLMFGHWDTQALGMKKDPAEVTKINTGIGIVVPSDKIMEVLNQDALRLPRMEKKRQQQAQNHATMDFGDGPKRGPKPDRLKLEGDYADRIKDSFKAKPPPKRKPKKG